MKQVRENMLAIQKENCEKEVVRGTQLQTNVMNPLKQAFRKRKKIVRNKTVFGILLITAAKQQRSKKLMLTRMIQMFIKKYRRQ